MLSLFLLMQAAVPVEAAPVKTASVTAVPIVNMAVQRSSRTIEKTADGIVIKDHDGRIVRVINGCYLRVPITRIVPFGSSVAAMAQADFVSRALAKAQTKTAADPSAKTTSSPQCSPQNYTASSVKTDPRGAVTMAKFAAP